MEWDRQPDSVVRAGALHRRSGMSRMRMLVWPGSIGLCAGAYSRCDGSKPSRASALNRALPPHNHRPASRQARFDAGIRRSANQRALQSALSREARDGRSTPFRASKAGLGAGGANPLPSLGEARISWRRSARRSCLTPTNETTASAAKKLSMRTWRQRLLCATGSRTRAARWPGPRTFAKASLSSAWLVRLGRLRRGGQSHASGVQQRSPKSQR
jgi:hypothetical protein